MPIKSLPVMMHHYVCNSDNSIAVPPPVFEEQCRALAGKGWRGVGLEEAEAYFTEGRPLPEKSVLITFDDGYLDNFIHAEPILKRYGHKGVIFAVSGRLEPEGRVRSPQGADLPELDNPFHFDARGSRIRQDVFCNHEEVREMDRGGTLTVASHSRNHYSVFTGPEFKDFIRPGEQLRTFYLTGTERPWGLPAFRQKAGLAHRAFLPSTELLQGIKALVPQDTEGAYAFFDDAEHVARLAAFVRSLKDGLGRFESREEQEARMWEQLKGGKDDLEAILGREVLTLCWPWGECSGLALELAKKAGFRVFVTTREGVNPPGRPDAVCRFKAKAKSGSWLLSRVRIYSRPVLGGLYARLRT